MPRPTGSPPQLKWHNTLPQHFSGCQVSNNGGTLSRGAYKRQMSSLNDESMFNGAGFSQKHNTLHAPRSTRGSNIASPTKRHRSSEVLSTMATPVKMQTAIGNISSAGSGMQTPPPSMGKRRGRPPKGTIVNETDAAGISPLSYPRKQNGHMQDISDFVPAITVNFYQNIVGSHNPQENLPTAISRNEGPAFLSAYEVPHSNPPLTLSDLQSSAGDFDSDLPEIFAGSAQFYNLPSFDQTDLTAFSFRGDPNYSNYVDPNLLFSSRGTSDQSSQVGAWSDDLEHGLSPITEKPYQHQHNYRKRERELELKRQKMRDRALKQKSLEANGSLVSRFGFYDPNALRHSFSEGVLPNRKEPSFRASKLDAAVSRGLIRSITPPASRGGSVPKTPKVKTEVVLSISPSGQAKTETKVVCDSDTEIDMTPSELEDLKNLEESQESDSSLDDPEPRGLGPGGNCYRLSRKQKNADTTTPRSRPRIGRFQVTPMTEYAHDLDWNNSDEELTIPERAFPSRTRRAASTTFGEERIRRKSGIDSSNRLKENHRRIVPATRSLSRNDARITRSGKTGERVLSSDESEAETVVDQDEFPLEKTISTAKNENDDGSALEALKSVMAKRKPSTEVSYLGKISNNSRPSSSSKHHVFSAGTHSVISRAKPLPIDHALGKSPLPARKSLRRSRTAPDGGYAHDIRVLTGFCQADDTGSNTSSTDEEMVIEDLIRCICGMNEDGGRVMIQCDCCNGWLHLKCVGLHAKSLPETFTCAFCNGENQQPKGSFRRNSVIQQHATRRSR